MPVAGEAHELRSVLDAAPQLPNGLEAGEQQQDLEALSFHLVSSKHKDFQVHVRRDAEFESKGVARVDIHHLAGRRITDVEVNELLEEVSQGRYRSSRRSG